MIRLERSFALSNLYVTNIDDGYANENILPLISNEDQIRVKTSFGKDKLNAAHLRDTRQSMLKSIPLVATGVLMLIMIGGIISVIVYHIKKC
ncbi:hypothetical protein I4U23_019284 [Adineta vaga]|nr:hypothetical protein I4U23_019284 [Adineta vaga]